jgi:hypothetical protein
MAVSDNGTGLALGAVGMFAALALVGPAMGRGSRTKLDLDALIAKTRPRPSSSRRASARPGAKGSRAATEERKWCPSCWTVEDVQTVFPVSRRRAEAFLDEHWRDIDEQITPPGWDAIERMGREARLDVPRITDAIEEDE